MKRKRSDPDGLSKKNSNLLKPMHFFAPRAAKACFFEEMPEDCVASIIHNMDSDTLLQFRFCGSWSNKLVKCHSRTLQINVSRKFPGKDSYSFLASFKEIAYLRIHGHNLLSEVLPVEEPLSGKLAIRRIEMKIRNAQNLQHCLFILQAIEPSNFLQELFLRIKYRFIQLEREQFVSCINRFSLFSLILRFDGYEHHEISLNGLNVERLHYLELDNCHIRGACDLLRNLEANKRIHCLHLSSCNFVSDSLKEVKQRKIKKKREIPNEIVNHATKEITNIRTENDIEDEDGDSEKCWFRFVAQETSLQHADISSLTFDTYNDEDIYGNYGDYYYDQKRLWKSFNKRVLVTVWEKQDIESINRERCWQPLTYDCNDLSTLV